VGVANSLSEGDFSVKIEVQSRDETGMLLTSMKNMVERLSQIITEVRGAATISPARRKKCRQRRNP